MPVGPTRRPAPRRTARPRSRGRRPAPPAAGRAPSSTAATRVSAAPGCTCQKPEPVTCQVAPGGLLVQHLRPVGEGRRRRGWSPAGAARRSTRRSPRRRSRSGHSVPVTVRQVRVRDPAVVDRHDVVRAVLAQAGRRPAGRPPTAPGCASRGRRRSPGTASTVDVARRGRRAAAAARATTAALSVALRRRARRAGSRSRRSGPGPANGHGGVDPVGRGLEHLDGVAAQEPVALLALGDLDDDPLAGQRVPDEDDDALVPGDARSRRARPVRPRRRTAPPPATGRGPSAGAARGGRAGSMQVPAAVLRPSAGAASRRGGRRRRATWLSARSARCLAEHGRAQLVGHRGHHHARA